MCSMPTRGGWRRRPCCWGLRCVTIQCLASAADNRASYGCIDVSPAFFERHVQALFRRHRANVFVLPDVRSVDEVFGGPFGSRRRLA